VDGSGYTTRYNRLPSTIKDVEVLIARAFPRTPREAHRCLALPESTLSFKLPALILELILEVLKEGPADSRYYLRYLENEIILKGGDSLINQ
jgi:hypothetical protein